MPKYFVWVLGSRGPEAQLWTSEPVDGNGKPVKGTLFKQKLSEQEELLSFSQLITKFEKNKPDVSTT